MPDAEPTQVIAAARDEQAGGRRIERLQGD
jgi:hypothetical protein